MNIHQKIRVHGRVQKVGFRQAILEKAIELKMSGFVKNETDGTVYIESEGSQALIDQFIEWCYIGSVLSKVKRIDIHSGDMVGYKSFNIIR